MNKIDIDNIKADENGMVRLKDLQEAAMDDRLNEWQQLPSVIKVLTSYEMGHWLRRRQGRIKEETIDRVLEIIDAQVCCGRLSANDFRAAVLALRGGEKG